MSEPVLSLGDRPPRRWRLRSLGREVPADKHSPSMDLHPMFRADVAAKDAAFLHSWTA